MTWIIERLTAFHDVSKFDCSEPSLDNFLRKHALNNDKAGLGRTYVAVEADSSLVHGYFTVATGSITFSTIPDHARKRLPKYPIPTIHIGRLAVDKASQSKRLGETLLVESLRKAAIASRGVGVYAVDLFALNERAKRFYLKYGFVELLDVPMHLFLPIETARAVAKIIDE